MTAFASVPQKGRRVVVVTTSKNKLKCEAARKAVSDLLLSILSW